MRFKHYYVPLTISINWVGKDGGVSYYDNKEKRVVNTRAIKLFYEYVENLEEDDIEMIRYYDSLLDDALLPLCRSDFSSLDTSMYFELLSLYMRSPGYRRYYLNEKSFLRMGIGRLNEDRFLISILNEVYSRNIYMWDLEPVILTPPSVSGFVLSSNPVVMADPYFEKKRHIASDTYALNGILFILPLRPDRALLLYDKNAYSIISSDGISQITEEDTALINRMSIYRSLPDGGFLIPGEKKDIGTLNSSYEEIKGFVPDYIYPFSVDFSFLKRRKTKLRGYVREYVEKLRDMDRKEVPWMIRDPDKLSAYLKRKNEYAISLLSSTEKNSKEE